MGPARRPRRSIRRMVHERLDETRWRGLLEELRRISLELPEASETLNFGNPWFRAGRRPFAIFSVRDGVPGVSFRADPFARELLLDDDRYVPTPYMHQHGWVTLRLVEPVDWDEVEEHLLDSYRLQALKRMLRALDD